MGASRWSQAKYRHYHHYHQVWYFIVIIFWVLQLLLVIAKSFMSPEKKFRHFLQLLPWAKALIQCWVQELCSGIFWVIEEEDCYEYIKFLSQILNTSLYAFYQRVERGRHFCRNIQFSSKVLFRPHCSRECSQWRGKIKPLYWLDKWNTYQARENFQKLKF